MILKAGIPVAEGVSMMLEDLDNREGKQILEKVHEETSMGQPLWMALEAAGYFPKYMVDMTRIGESTGKLDNVMDSLSSYYEREEELAKSIRSAVTYPLVMVAMMLVVITVLVVRVMPIFQRVFESLGSEMTGFSAGVMRFGELAGRYSFVVFAVIAALVIAFFIMRATAGGRATLDRWKATFFATRNLNAKIASGRFASAMSLMLSSGMDTDESLEMVGRLVDNRAMHENIESLKKQMADGATFPDALTNAGIFSGVNARMVAVGFRTGSVDLVMEKLARRYEEEIDAQINGMIAVLEPTLVAILSVIVGVILLSVMLPLMGIMSSIG
jgi:type IV pilus assembly protein PilC